MKFRWKMKILSKFWRKKIRFRLNRLGILRWGKKYWMMSLISWRFSRRDRFRICRKKTRLLKTRFKFCSSINNSSSNFSRLVAPMWRIVLRILLWAMKIMVINLRFVVAAILCKNYWSSWSVRDLTLRVMILAIVVRRLRPSFRKWGMSLKTRRIKWRVCWKIKKIWSRRYRSTKPVKKTRSKRWRTWYNSVWKIRTIISSRKGRCLKLK